MSFKEMTLSFFQVEVTHLLASEMQQFDISFLPLTAASGPEGTRTLLLEQV